MALHPQFALQRETVSYNAGESEGRSIETCDSHFAYKEFVQDHGDLRPDFKDLNHPEEEP
jgi:hypothetical protein